MGINPTGWQRALELWLLKQGACKSVELSVGSKAREPIIVFECDEAIEVQPELFEYLSCIQETISTSASYAVRTRNAESRCLSSTVVSVPPVKPHVDANTSVISALQKSVTESHDALIRITATQHDSYAQIIKTQSDNMNTLSKENTELRVLNSELQGMCKSLVKTIEDLHQELSKQQSDDKRMQLIINTALRAVTGKTQTQLEETVSQAASMIADAKPNGTPNGN
jgi:chromosome segregation ATPase